jgi:nucleotide-binding universal stress UspA family protein
MDFSDASRAALLYALALVEGCGASLHVLHVLEVVAGAEPLEWRFDARSEIERAIERSAWDDLRRQLSDDDHARFDVRLALEWGIPVVEILRYARTYPIDFIALGRHGRGGFKHLLMGSVAEQVVRRAPCTVSICQPATRSTAGDKARAPRMVGH